MDAFYQQGGVWVSDFAAAAATAVATMDAAGIDISLVMPPPFVAAKAASPLGYDHEELSAWLATEPDRNRFGFIAGGGTLQPILEATCPTPESTDPDCSPLTPEVEADFVAQANAVADAGAAAFGELAALHFSLFDGHSFEQVRPDHDLLMRLADIAAARGMPLDLHMEAVVADMPTPGPLLALSSQNPPTVSENVTKLEALLAHNRAARIVWAHIGWDNTGQMTTTLLRDLLLHHSNLYLQLKVVAQEGIQSTENRPVDASGALKAEWVSLVQEFPDRFVMGADEFYGIAGKTPARPPSAASTRAALGQLPADVARRVGMDNVLAVYRFAG